MYESRSQYIRHLLRVIMLLYSSEGLQSIVLVIRMPYFSLKLKLERVFIRELDFNILIHFSVPSSLEL
jgi:hypothetical protein